MNWNAIGASGEVFGAIAVVATLIYLARQVTQGVALARATQNKEIQAAWSAFNEQVLTHPELAGLLDQLENPTREFSSIERVQLRHLAYRFANVWLSAQVAYSHGQLSRPEFDFFKQDVVVMFRTYPGLMPFMQQLSDLYPQSRTMEIFEAFHTLASGSA